MRWNIAGTLLIIFLTNFILFICSWSLSWQNQHNNSLLVIALGAFIISIAMFKLHYKATAEGYFSRINQGLEAINNAYTNKIEK
jgi:low temperature requirement protein LtrA